MFLILFSTVCERTRSTNLFIPNITNINILKLLLVKNKKSKSWPKDMFDIIEFIICRVLYPMVYLAVICLPSF